MSDVTLEGLVKRVEALEVKVKELQQSRVVTWVLFTIVVLFAAAVLIFRMKAA